jgi:hypothetical protein
MPGVPFDVDRVTLEGTMTETVVTGRVGSRLFQRDVEDVRGNALTYVAYLRRPAGQRGDLLLEPVSFSDQVGELNQVVYLPRSSRSSVLLLRWLNQMLWTITHASTPPLPPAREILARVTPG